jgi:hypothetical protein
MPDLSRTNIRDHEAAHTLTLRLGVHPASQVPAVPGSAKEANNQPHHHFTMKTNRVLLVMLIASGAIWACNKEDNDDDPATPPTTPADNTVFDALIADNIAGKTQTFTANNEWGGQIVAEHGTELNYEPGAFVHEDGTPVTGQVDIAVVEVLTIGDMIWLNKQTVGNDNGTLKMLRSGGAINISVTQGGEPLQVTSGGLQVQMPTIIGDPAMQLFNGTEDANGKMIWNPSPTTPVSVVPAYIDLFYSFYPDSLNWINCDYFYSYPNTTMLEATIPAGQSTDSTQVWIAFPTQNAVMQMNHTTGQAYSTWQVIPVGMQAVIVGLRQSPGGYFSSFTTVTIAEDMTVPMTFTPTTLPQFEAALDGL